MSLANIIQSDSIAFIVLLSNKKYIMWARLLVHVSTDAGTIYNHHIDQVIKQWSIIVVRPSAWW